MKMKRFHAVLLAFGILCTAAGCGSTTDTAGSAEANQTDAPSLQELYANNTLENYREAGIQGSFSTCLRETKDDKTEEWNNLATMYAQERDEVGFVVRDRIGNVPFTYYFNHDGTDFSILHTVTTDEQTQEQQESIELTAHPQLFEQTDGEQTKSLAEQKFEEQSFGSYDAREKLISVTDCGDTYHYVTDISAFSEKNMDGTYNTYDTREYDVDKETLFILNTMEIYQKEEKDGTTKKCMFYRCLSYGTTYASVPQLIDETIADSDWSRTFTLIVEGDRVTFQVPKDIPVKLELPEGYTAYTDSSCQNAFTGESGTLSDETLYVR